MTRCRAKGIIAIARERGGALDDSTLEAIMEEHERLEVARQKRVMPLWASTYDALLELAKSTE